MINLLVDEGYAFDYLSILNIKHLTDVKNINMSEMYKNCIAYLVEQIGTDRFNEIILSKEYIELYLANEETFKLVYLAKEDKVRASEVDSSNYNRFLKKSALQKAFFYSFTKEVKIGYNE